MDNIPERYSLVLDLMVSCKGVLFGGAVRDLLRGDIPTDLDISVREYQKFYDSLESLGYIPIDNTFTRYQRSGILIDIVENDSEEELVPTIIDPDFDVNMLAYDGYNIFYYRDEGPNIDDILQNIKLKMASPIRPTSKRMEKMIKKGWHII